MTEVERRGAEFGRAIREAEDANDEQERRKQRRAWIVFKFGLSPLDYSRATNGYYREYAKEMPSYRDGSTTLPLGSEAG